MATRTRKKKVANVQFVTEVMEFSRNGALMHCFIMDALQKWSTLVANVPLEELEKKMNTDTCLFNAYSWQQCAIELRDAIEKRLEGI